MGFERARAIAETLLYEGYILYPYRASSAKNQFRWQFGLLAPRAWSEAGGCEPWWMQTECLIATAGGFGLTLKIRFLQVQQRNVERAVEESGDRFEPADSIEVDGQLFTPWDEAVEREVDYASPISAERASHVIPFEFPGSFEPTPIAASGGRVVGRYTRTREPISGLVRLDLYPVESDLSLTKLRVRIENTTPFQRVGARREDALPCALAAVHTLLRVESAEFVSLIDPPAAARGAAGACDNVRTWPVLVGDEPMRDTMLSAPIILYDYPQIAAESPGNLFDSTEIDELLTLRTMTLTDEEKRIARATDPRVATIVDRVETMPPQVFDRLHGAVRNFRCIATAASPDAQAVPWWEQAADAAARSAAESLEVEGVAVAKGSRVRLRPGCRRADAQDMFLAGRVARVEGVYRDVDGRDYFGVTLEDDPGADLYHWHGRYLYFFPDEVAPLERHS